MQSEEGSESEEEHQHVRHHGPKHAEHPAKPVKKAAAALSVGVGSLSDPWDIQVGQLCNLAAMAAIGYQ